MRDTVGGSAWRTAAARLQRSGTRPLLLALLLLVLLAAVALAGLGLRSGPAGPNWLPAFIAPLHPPLGGDARSEAQALRMADLTLRQFVPLALPGQALRVRLSNEFGEHPLHIGAGGVAWRDGRSGSAIVAGSTRTLSFDGAPSVRLAAGASVLSDPLTMPEGGGADLALSLYLPQPTPRASWHPVGSRGSFRSKPGNHVDAVEMPVAAVERDILFLAAVEVDAPPRASLWVAFGDSITAGAWHQLDADASWPAVWGQAWRARADAAAPPVGVLNAGVGGDRLLEPVRGPSGSLRFERDVMTQPGVRGVVIAIGINDIGAGAPELSRSQQVDRLVAAHTTLAARARSRGLKVVGATLTPVGGSAYGRPEVEAARQQFNQWLRSTSAFDAVVDFDAVVRDPHQPQRIRASWTTDWLHPDDAGYHAMAQAIVQAIDRAGLAPE